MELVQYNSNPNNWDDLIKGFDSKTLFHETSWHRHILSIFKNSKIEYFYIKEKDKIVGYFCGLTIRKLFFNIIGSPLGGTGTNYMGPVVNKNIDQEALFDAINNMCINKKIAHLEICNDLLSNEVMRKYGFDRHYSITHKIMIQETEEKAFSTLKSVCRNRIRKGKKNNLKVEITDDPSILDYYFEQLKEVYGKQGIAVPFQKDRVISLYESLYKIKRLLPVWVKLKQKVIATGLFPYDENAIYFWGGASWLEYQKYYPNESLHWEIIKYAQLNHIKEYNMCGGSSQFKDKFGGNDTAHITYSKSYFYPLKYMRSIFQKAHFLELKMKGKFQTKKYRCKELKG
jgi:GNAT acetyltransferase-like protein